MKYGILPLVLSLGLFSYACESDDDNDTVGIQPAPANPGSPMSPAALAAGTASKLAGSYETRCLRKGILDLTSSTRTINFAEGGAYEKNETYFLGDDCGTSPSLNFRVKGTLAENGRSADPVPVTYVDFTVNEAYITILKESLVVSVNEAGFCGKSDWVIGQETSIAGSSCAGVTVNAGDVIQDVYAVEEDHLYFGETFALLLEGGDARPTGVNRDISYDRK